MMTYHKNSVANKNHITRYCEHCDDENHTHVEVREETLNVRGVSIQTNSEVRICKVCNQPVFDEYLDGLNIEKAFEIYREEHQLMSKEDIVEIRKKYGLSQRGLAILLGWGPATVARYETGAIPSNSHHMVLLNLRDNLDFVHKVFSENKDKLAKLDYQRMKLKLDDQNKLSSERDTIALLAKKMNEVEDLIYQGYADFDFNKLVEMVIYLTTQPGKVSKTKLMKLLFYSDFRNFSETGLSMSGMTYRHLPFGPVPDHHYLILDVLCELGHIRLEPFENFEGEYLVPEIESDISIFDEDEIIVLESVINDFRNMNAYQISEYSHREKAYTNTENKEYISYEYADSLNNVFK